MLHGFRVRVVYLWQLLMWCFDRAYYRSPELVFLYAYYAGRSSLSRASVPSFLKNIVIYFLSVFSSVSYGFRRIQKWNGRSCGKIPVRLISGTWVATAPESRQFCLVFVDLFAGGGARQRQQWHLIPLPTRAGIRWQMVWQGPRLGFVAETGRFVAMETPWVRFSCLLAFVPCFLLFVFLFFLFLFFSLHPGMFIFFVSLRLCSSHLLLSASTYFIVRVLSACVICTLPHLGILLFFIRLVFFS